MSALSYFLLRLTKGICHGVCNSVKGLVSQIVMRDVMAILWKHVCEMDFCSVAKRSVLSEASSDWCVINVLLFISNHFKSMQ